MKAIFPVLLLLLTSLQLQAQDIRIPYRVGDQFGLSDQSGQIKVKPNYDQIDHIQGPYFKYSNHQLDTVKTYSGRLIPQKETSTGLIVQDKVLIADSPHRDYIIYPGRLIAGSQNGLYPENAMLYDFKGKALLKEEVRRAFVDDERHYPIYLPQSAGLCFIAILHNGLSKKGAMSLAVYDIKQQKITQWLIEKARNFEVGERRSGTNLTACTYQDEQSGVQNKFIAYNYQSKQVELVEAAQGSQSRYKTKAQDEVEGTEKEDVDGDSSGSLGLSYRSSSDKDDPQKEHIDVYLELQKDSSLTYDKKPVPSIPGAQYQLAYKRQLFPPIYRLNGKYGIITSDSTKTKATYDSLFYINRWSKTKDKSIFKYIVGQQNRKDKTWTFGVIDQYGNEVIPMIYDTLRAYISELYYEQNKYSETFIAQRNPRSGREKKNKLFVLNSEGWLTATKAGKKGIIDINNQSITALEFEEIFKNGLGGSNFYVFKKDGKYGFFYTPQDLSTDQIIAQLRFPRMPLQHLKDYAGKEGFNLVSLAGRYQAFCYAKEDGFLYYKE